MQTTPTSFSFGSGDTFDDVRDCIPSRLLALAAKGPVLLGIQAPVVSVVGLAHLAASLGRSCLLDDGLSQIPACFNLAVITDGTLPFDWLTPLGRGWVDEATRFQNLDAESVQAVIRDAVKNCAAKGPDRSRINPQMEAFAETIPMSVVNMMRRRTIISSITPKAVMRAVAESRDLCVALLNGANDPMAEWAALSPGQQKELTEALLLGWQSKPLTLNAKGTEVHGMVHGLWLTREKAIQKALFAKTMTTSNQSAPVLLCRHSGNPQRLPDVESPEIAGWSQCLQAAFGYRQNSTGSNSVSIAIDLAARRIAEDFYGEFAAALSSADSCLHPYLSWLPELPLRLYVTLITCKSIETLLDKNGAQSSKFNPADQRNAMSKAVRLTRWLAQEHYKVVASLIGNRSTDSSIHATDNTDTEALEDRILQKLHDAGPQSPRQLQRSFHELSAKTRDAVIQRLKTKGQVTESPDGTLERAA